MNQTETSISSESQARLSQWLSGGQISGLEVSSVAQAAPNSYVQVYRVSLDEIEILAKVFTAKFPAAEKEITHNTFYSDRPFIPKLKVVTRVPDKILLGFDFIEGSTFHDRSTQIKADGADINSNIAQEAISQICSLSSSGRDISTLVFSAPSPLASPIREGFLSEKEGIQFAAAYAPVIAANRHTISLFPGVFSDRNPRNMMIDTAGLHQIDFGHLENTSVIFDIAKFMRNGTDASLPVSRSEFQRTVFDLDLARSLTVFNPSIETDLLKQTAEMLHIPDSQLGDFYRAFSYGSLHYHFFYLSKYGKMIKEGQGNTSILTTRFLYHTSMSKELIKTLGIKDSQLSGLSCWLKKMVSIVVPYIQ